MKLIMTLLVRDEADIIGANIDFHLARGVDYVIAIDNGSTDGTRDILNDYVRSGVAMVFDEPKHDFSQAKWVSRAALLARDTFGADWVINNDADEFWTTPSGNLKDVAHQATSPLLQCPRLNMVCGYETLGRDISLSELVYRIADPRPRPHLANIYTSHLEVPYFYLNLPSKAMLRTAGLVSVHQGNHSATFKTKQQPVLAPIEIFHYPVRSRPQFAKKIVQGGEAYAANRELASTVGWHWRRWHRKYLEGGLDTVLAEAFPSQTQLIEDLENGTAVADYRCSISAKSSLEK